MKYVVSSRKTQTQNLNEFTLGNLISPKFYTAPRNRASKGFCRLLAQTASNAVNSCSLRPVSKTYIANWSQANSKITGTLLCSLYKESSLIDTIIDVRYHDLCKGIIVRYKTIPEIDLFADFKLF